MINTPQDVLENLWDIINDHVEMVPASRGWYHTNCKVCNDHGKKGRRGGFKKEENAIGYNCFNCNESFRFSTDTLFLGKNAKKILSAFEIESDIIDGFVFNCIKVSNGESGTSASVKQRPKPVKLEPVQLPQGSVPLNQLPSDDYFFNLANNHLQAKRNLTTTSYPFSVCTDIDNKKWVARLIIPVFMQGKIVYYEGLDLTGKRSSKYKSAPVDASAVIYGANKLDENLDSPLFVTEGFFDAFHIDGVCIFGKKLTTAQIRMLNKSPRRKVIIPDYSGDGFDLVEQALREDWSISFPDFGTSSDVNDAVVRYGLPYVLDSIYDNIVDGNVARCIGQVKCK